MIAYHFRGIVYYFIQTDFCMPYAQLILSGHCLLFEWEFCAFLGLDSTLKAHPSPVLGKIQDLFLILLTTPVSVASFLM